MCVCAFVYVFVCGCVHMRVCKCVRARAYIYVCVCESVCVCVCEEMSMLPRAIYLYVLLACRSVTVSVFSSACKLYVRTCIYMYSNE